MMPIELLLATFQLSKIGEANGKNFLRSVKREPEPIGQKKEKRQIHGDAGREIGSAAGGVINKGNKGAEGCRVTRGNRLRKQEGWEDAAQNKESVSPIPASNWRMGGGIETRVRP